MLIVSLSKHKNAEGGHMVLCLLNIIFGHVKEVGLGASILPGLCLSQRDKARAFPCFEVHPLIIVDVILFRRPPCGENILHSAPFTVHSKFTAFLHRPLQKWPVVWLTLAVACILFLPVKELCSWPHVLLAFICSTDFSLFSSPFTLDFWSLFSVSHWYRVYF